MADANISLAGLDKISGSVIMHPTPLFFTKKDEIENIFYMTIVKSRKFNIRVVFHDEELLKEADYFQFTIFSEDGIEHNITSGKTQITRINNAVLYHSFKFNGSTKDNVFRKKPTWFLVMKYNNAVIALQTIRIMYGLDKVTMADKVPIKFFSQLNLSETGVSDEIQRSRARHTAEMDLQPAEATKECKKSEQNPRNKRKASSLVSEKQTEGPPPKKHKLYCPEDIDFLQFEDPKPKRMPIYRISYVETYPIIDLNDDYQCEDEHPQSPVIDLNIDTQE